MGDYDNDNYFFKKILTEIKKTVFDEFYISSDFISFNTF